MVFTNYQLYFSLRDKYPEHCKLIAELMSYAFQHKDSFSYMTYLNGKYDEKDVILIFKELNLPIKKVLYSNERSKICTIVELGLNSMEN